MPEQKRVKIRFKLNPEDEQGYEVEQLWAERVDRDHFRILNSPFFAFGISAEDIVRAKSEDETYCFEEVIRRGRHSTYRIFLQADYTIHDDVFQQGWRPLSMLGCTFENANDRLVAVDVPVGVNVPEVYRLLQKGEEEGIWIFEEAHYAGT